MSVFGVFLVLIFPKSQHLSVFSQNAGKYGPKKSQIRTLFTQYETRSRGNVTPPPLPLQSFLRTCPVFEDPLKGVLFENIKSDIVNIQ